MEIEGLHLLLTYKCDQECEHCFVWSSPRSDGTMSVRQVKSIVDQAAEIPSIRTIYFEGGEPFLFYPILIRGVEYAQSRGFDIGVVTDAYWASDEESAALWLEPLLDKGIVDFSISTDEFHGTGEQAQNARRAARAAEKAGLPVSWLRIRGMDACATGADGEGDEFELYFRGRAAEKLGKRAKKRPWNELTHCPEDPPGIRRLHVDAYGNLQFCQGISIGNVWAQPLAKILDGFIPEKHPMIGPLIEGGPVALSRSCGVKPADDYPDACQFCYAIRTEMISRRLFRGVLRPLQCYGMEAVD